MLCDKSGLLNSFDSIRGAGGVTLLLDELLLDETGTLRQTPGAETPDVDVLCYDGTLEGHRLQLKVKPMPFDILADIPELRFAVTGAVLLVLPLLAARWIWTAGQFVQLRQFMEQPWHPAGCDRPPAERGAGLSDQRRSKKQGV